jgi:hypothetical protein
MDFLFHSVIETGHHTKFFNVYKIDEDHFLAECHHFNRQRDCEGDVELVRENGEWKAADPRFLEVAKQIKQEIERMEPHGEESKEEGPRALPDDPTPSSL